MYKSVLVLGAGVGGVVSARALRKMTGKDTRILLFEKEEKMFLLPRFFG